MNKRIILIVICFGLLTSFTSIQKESSPVPTQTAQAEWSCISTFDDYLYQMVRIDRFKDERYDLPTIYPSSPWKLYAEIPEMFYKNNNPQIELTRVYGGKTELWIRSGYNLIKHNIKTGDFSFISDFPYDEYGKNYEDVVVRDLFEISIGMIVGVNYPVDYDTVWQEAVPLFSIFNDLENKFEFYDIGLEYLADQIYPGSVGMIYRNGVLISESYNLIWIYQEHDGLYSYNPKNSKLRHYETAFEGVVQRMVTSQEGFLLFSQKREPSWELSPGDLLKYYPESQTMEEISISTSPWADNGNLLYTNSGDLWIGIHGYLSKDGSWVVKNPDMPAHIDLGRTGETYNWQQPDLLFQSSNGYLWYTNNKWDSIGVNGSAWYDPILEKGCWFTTEPGNILEDDLGNLWMVTGNKIFTVPISQ